MLLTVKKVRKIETKDTTETETTYKILCEDTDKTAKATITHYGTRPKFHPGDTLEITDKVKQARL